MREEVSIMKWSLEELKKQAYDAGFAYEKNCAYCPQASIAALQDVFQIRNDDLFRASYGFHAGGANKGIGMCGALCGGILTIGFMYGRSRTEFNYGKINPKGTILVGKLMDKFQKEFGDIICRAVQKDQFGRSFNLEDKEELKLFLKMGGHDDKCPHVVGTGAALAAEIIWQELDSMRAV